MSDLTRSEQVTYNKRANFYIMRKLWVSIRGKRRHGETIHGRLGMSRPRYARFIYGEPTQVTQAEYSKWEAMGITRSVIDGKELINVPRLSFSEWVSFFEAWDNSRHKADNKELKDKYIKRKKYIDERIEGIKKSEINTPTLQKIYAFIEEAPDKETPPDMKISFALNLLRGIQMPDLLEVSLDRLQEYISTLSEQCKAAEAVNIVRSYAEK